MTNPGSKEVVVIDGREREIIPCPDGREDCEALHLAPLPEDEPPERISINPAVAARYPVTDKRVGDIEYTRISTDSAGAMVDIKTTIESTIQELRRSRTHEPKYCCPEDEAVYDRLLVRMLVERLSAVPRNEAAQDELVDEVQHRMDQVVEAAVEWHNAGREGGEWFEAADPLVSDCDPDN